MEEVLRPDLCVIGGGAGGLAVAAGAAQLGASVILVERDRIGGNVLNHGSVASKALLAAAKRARAIDTALPFGVDVLERRIDLARVHDHVHGAIAAVAPNYSAERFTGLGIRVIEAEASFVDKVTASAGEHKIEAKRFVIATGSSPVIPAVPGLDAAPYLTTETIFDLSEAIPSLIVLGAGSVAVELAFAYRLLGCEVTLIDPGPLLSAEDAEAVHIMAKQLQALGIALRTEARIDRVERSGEGLAVHFGGEESTVTASHLLVAGARTPNLASLDLAAAKIKHGPGGIKVNSELKTSNSRVYAIGDAVGGPPLANLAAYQARIVIGSAVLRARPKLGGVVPHVTYISPELAQVGPTEREARAKFGSLRIYRFPYADNERAQAERETEGFIKVLTTRNNIVVGCTIVGASAGELISLWTLAIAKEMRIGEFAAFLAPHPALSELSKRVASSHQVPALTKGFVHSIIKALRRFR